MISLVAPSNLLTHSVCQLVVAFWNAAVGPVAASQAIGFPTMSHPVELVSQRENHEMAETILGDVLGLDKILSDVSASETILDDLLAPEAMQSTIVVRVSADHYLEAPRFQLYVDGKAVGEVQTVTADRSAGEWQEITVTGDFGVNGPCEVAIRYLNDHWAGRSDKDRNLYVDCIEVNGKRFEAEDASYVTFDHPGTIGGREQMAWNGEMRFETEGAAPVTPQPDGDPAPEPNPGPTVDTITVRVSGDHYQGAPEFRLYVDGKPVGEPQRVSAVHGKGEWQEFTFTGDFSEDGPAKVEIRYLNDAWGGSDGKDRNLYVDSIEVNGQRYEAEDPTRAVYLRDGGQTLAGQEKLSWQGTLRFTTEEVASTPSEPAPPEPEQDRIVVRVSGDHHDGAPRFQLYVDGKAVGEVQTVTADRSAGEWQEFVFAGDFGGDGPAKVEIRYLNDAWGGSESKDRNLHVDYIEVNGRRYESEDPTRVVYLRDSGQPLAGQEKMSWQGTLRFTTEDVAPVPSEPAPADPAPSEPEQDRIVVRVSGDHYDGAPRFQLYVDGKAVGEVQTVSADHSAGEWQEFVFAGDFGDDGPGNVTVRFLNDAWGGSEGKDRNLYVDSIEVNGQRYEAEDGSLATYVRDGGKTLDGQEKMSWSGKLVFDLDGSSKDESPADSTPPDNGASKPPSSGTGANPPDLDITQPSGPGEVVGFRLTAGESAEAGRIVTFGQVFAPGDVAAGETLVAIIDGKAVPLQVDVKATHPDGSIRHAVLSVEAPELGVGESVDVMLAKGTPAAQPSIDVASILESGYDLELIVDGQVFGVADLLAQALADGSASAWLNGPLASEVRVEAPISADGNLHATFDIRVHADGSVRTDVALAYDWAYSMGMDNITYDVEIRDKGQTVVRYDGLDHHHHATWHKVVWSGAEPDINVVRDVPYLAKSGAIPGYDSSIAISGAELDKDLDRLADVDTGPMGNALVEMAMPNTGGRPDIGPTTTWGARYLLSQDPRALEVMLSNADAAGSIPWHFRDNETGEYVRVDERPKLWIDYRGVGGRYGEDQLPEAFSSKAGTGWITDTAHQPALSYLPYLFTGSRYYLDELHAQTSYTIASFNPEYRGFERGIIDMDQLRTKAWSLRTIGDAAYITPDDHSLKEYFEQILDNNLQQFVNRYVIGGFMDEAGEVEGWIHGLDEAGTTSPWQNDFMTIIMSTLAQRGHEEARTMLDWMTNFVAGRFLNAENGFDPLQGAAYKLKVYDPVTKEKYSTWEEVFQHTFPDGAKFSHLHLDYAFSYGAIAKGALASLISATGSPEAIEAYGYVVGQTTNFWDKYDEDPTWNIAPKLADGSLLTHADIHLGSGTLNGTDRNELLHGGDGADRLNGSGGIDLLYGGAGDDVIDGGAGNDYLFGNAGNDRLRGGSGDDVLKGNTGADVFVYDSANVGRDIILDFEIGTDRLEVSAQKTGVSSAADLLSTATTDVDGNAVLQFGSEGSVTLIGINPEELTTSAIHMV
jgi:hypothetical protein